MSDLSYWMDYLSLQFSKNLLHSTSLEIFLFHANPEMRKFGYCWYSLEILCQIPDQECLPEENCTETSIKDNDYETLWETKSEKTGKSYDRNISLIMFSLKVRISRFSLRQRCTGSSQRMLPSTSKARSLKVFFLYSWNFVPDQNQTFYSF